MYVALVAVSWICALYTVGVYGKQLWFLHKHTEKEVEFEEPDFRQEFAALTGKHSVIRSPSGLVMSTINKTFRANKVSADESGGSGGRDGCDDPHFARRSHRRSRI